MGWSNMGKDFRHPVLLVSRDDSQVDAEIHAELLDAVSERLDQCRIACVKLGLIEAEYEWPIVGCEQAQALQPPEAELIDFLRRGVAAALVVGSFKAKQFDFVGF